MCVCWGGGGEGWQPKSQQGGGIKKVREVGIREAGNLNLLYANSQTICNHANPEKWPRKLKNLTFIPSNFMGILSVVSIFTRLFFTYFWAYFGSDD